MATLGVSSQLIEPVLEVKDLRSSLERR